MILPLLNLISLRFVCCLSRRCNAYKHTKKRHTLTHEEINAHIATLIAVYSARNFLSDTQRKCGGITRNAEGHCPQCLLLLWPCQLQLTNLALSHTQILTHTRTRRVSARCHLSLAFYLFYQETNSCRNANGRS